MPENNWGEIQVDRVQPIDVDFLIARLNSFRDRYTIPGYPNKTTPLGIYKEPLKYETVEMDLP